MRIYWAFIVDVSESNMHNWNEFIIQSHVFVCARTSASQ